MKKSNNKFLTHFKKVDSILFSVVKDNDILIELTPREINLYFESLTSEIISQQLSGRVADVIFTRFKSLFPKKLVEPVHLMKLTHEVLRSTGMSNAKVRFLKDLAEKVIRKQLVLDNLFQMSNEDVMVELTKVKGIGPWTAEMFMMFSLAREDIFSHGDQGLKNAIKKLYKLENPTKDEVERISNKWSPYRTYACLILWKSLDS